MIRNFLQRVLYGRYGNDQLGIFLLIAYVVVYVLALLLDSTLLHWLGLILLLVEFCRMFSRKTARRRAENAKFLALAAPVTRKFNSWRIQHSDRDHCYFRCPNCKQLLRAPKGKGKLHITCRNCGHSFDRVC